MQNTTTERRRFFRIDDSISLSYQLIDEQTVSKGLNSLSQHLSGELSLVASLDALSQQAALILQRSEKQTSDATELFKILDAKINIIVQALTLTGSDINLKKCQDVNLSATGLAFHQSSALQIGQNLAIEMFLPTTIAIIRVIGKVVNCREIEPDNFLISIDYTNVTEEDQELLIRHVVRRQWQHHQENTSKSAL